MSHDKYDSIFIEKIKSITDKKRKAEKRKKSVIEFLVSIIVAILGVVLISLAILFVKNIFSNEDTAQSSVVTSIVSFDLE